MLDRLAPRDVVTLLSAISVLDHSLPEPALDLLLTQMRSEGAPGATERRGAAAPAAAVPQMLPAGAAARSAAVDLLVAQYQLPASAAPGASPAGGQPSASGRPAAGAAGALDAPQYVALLVALAGQGYRPRASLTADALDALLVGMGSLSAQVRSYEIAVGNTANFNAC